MTNRQLTDADIDALLPDNKPVPRDHVQIVLAKVEGESELGWEVPISRLDECKAGLDEAGMTIEAALFEAYTGQPAAAAALWWLAHSAVGGETAPAVREIVQEFGSARLLCLVAEEPREAKMLMLYRDGGLAAN